MKVINEIWQVSKYTLMEFLKSRVLINTIFISVAIFIVVLVASEISYGNPQKVALDLGLGALSMSLFIIALLMGSTLISREIEERTIYIILARGISRTSFYLGRIFGFAIALFINAFIITFFVLTLYFLLGGSFNSLLIYSVGYAYLSALIILCVVNFFSLFTNVTLSVLYTFIIYVIGNVLNETIVLTFVENRPFLGKVIDIIRWLVPNFSILNIKEYVLYENDLSFNYLFFVGVYGVFFCLVLMAISSFIFYKKDLE
ncbi:MAG: ABC transporter permease [Deltaproteobacteria bacterium]|nr:MAG: ABC transporter permease [Deltaproteobacteria bacterium]